MRQTLKLAKFDAELNTDCCDKLNNAELTIKLKLGFRQVNPARGRRIGTYHDYGDATEPTRNIVKWNEGAWSAWKANFVRSAQSYWNGKFWLLNRSGHMAFRVGTTPYIPNIYCRFQLIGSDSHVGTHHHVIDVVRLDPSETWFGSHWKLYDSLDTNEVEKARDSHNQPIMQRAHVHEVGHLLGLAHVDVGTAACPATGDTNAAACYGTTDASKNDVMGGGMTLHPHHATPWYNALTQFLTKVPSTTRIYAPPARLVHAWEVKMERHYPRTVPEFEAGTLVTSR